MKNTVKKLDNMILPFNAQKPDQATTEKRKRKEAKGFTSHRHHGYKRGSTCCDSFSHGWETKLVLPFERNHIGICHEWCSVGLNHCRPESVCLVLPLRHLSCWPQITDNVEWSLTLIVDSYMYNGWSKYRSKLQILNEKILLIFWTITWWRECHVDCTIFIDQKNETKLWIMRHQ